MENSERKKPSERVTLKVADLLPNLSDVLANPSKYDNQEAPKLQADENSLLRNIENVTFKPFDDGSRNFEIVNDFSDEPQQVIELYSDDFLAEKKSGVKAEESSSENKTVSTETIKPAVENKPVNTEIVKPTVVNKPVNNAPEKSINVKENVKCIIDGKSYNVISSVAITKNIGCHLAKDDEGYSVLSYSGNNIAILRKYSKLSSEKLQVRLSDKLANGTYRFIVRTGNVKFIADLKNGCINYVMDL